jgi:general nucleoside transport system ATP-binding protein
VLAAAAITRRFARTLALDRVDFRALPGEIHALVGENGAGKSTLINIFAGRLKPDRGVVSLDGVAIAAGSAHIALKAGIAAVYQSPMLFERMSWEENLALGGFGAGASRNNLIGAADRARILAARLNFKLPPAGASVERCSVGERVRLEILRALSFEPRVLILDEPTGVLAPAELGPFLDALRRLRAEGRIVVIVTHKLAEAIAVADRITVLRHGRVTAVRMAAETSAPELARLMIGDVTASAMNTEASAGGPAPSVNYGAPELIVEDLTLAGDGHRLLDGVTFTVAGGEIAGVAGVDGNGQRELVEVMAGIRAPTAGRLRVVADRDSMSVIPQNRDLDGLILDLTLWENLLLARAVRNRFTRGGWLRRSSAIEFCTGLLERYSIQSAGAASLAAALSGGNRQRLAVARALAADPRAIVAHDVCRGLDLRATAEVHRMLREFAAAGGAVLLISGDLEELLALSTSLYVITRGRLVATAAGDRDTGRIGLLMSGAAQP